MNLHERHQQRKGRPGRWRRRDGPDGRDGRDSELRAAGVELGAASSDGHEPLRGQ